MILNKNKNPGFVLIELLVVISIIGLMMSVISVATSKARSKARDSRRMADIRQIITALNLNYSTYGTFPCQSGWDNSYMNNFLGPLVTRGYIKHPKDPINTSAAYHYGYATFNDGTGCGDMAYLGFTTENSMTACPGSGFLIGNNHCHIFIPQAPTCVNLLDDNALNTCAFRDSSLTNEYSSS